MKRYLLFLSVFALVVWLSNVCFLAVKQRRLLTESYKYIRILEQDLKETGDFDIPRLKGSRKRWIEEIENYNKMAARTNMRTIRMITGEDLPKRIMQNRWTSTPIY